ncbi:MAG: type IV secretory system conjugative DNA transfer family protein [Methylococcales bacterium]
MSPRLVQLGIVTVLLIYATQYVGEPLINGQIQYIAAGVYFFAVLGSINLLVEGLTTLSRLFDWLGSHETTGKDGTAHWATYRDIKPELNPDQDGPFFGVAVVKPNKSLHIKVSSHVCTIGTTGSGKTISTVITNCLSIRESKIIPDFKGEISCILKKMLQARGEKVVILNPSNLWSDILGESDTYNPLDCIVDNLFRMSGLRDIIDNIREFCTQLLPEPSGKSSDDTYWREGSRRIILIAILIEVVVEEYHANLSSVARLIEDRNLLEDNLRWVLGVDSEGNLLPQGAMPIENTHWARQYQNEVDVDEFAAYFRAQASNLLAMMTGNDSKTFESFISGSTQALAPFAFGRLSTAMKQSSFSMDELKDGKQPVSLFIVADSSKMEVYKPYLGLIQWSAITALKRHPNKEVPVYGIMDEATNYKIHGLASLLTYGRSYNIRLHLIFQDLSAFSQTYGEKTLETLFSECQVKQFLPHQRNQKTLEIISKMLGQQSIMAAGLSNSNNTLNENTSEMGRSLMTPDEVRRSPFGLLLVKNLPPIATIPTSYSAIHPWRLQVAGNPFHGNKPFLEKVTLKLSGIWRKK